MQTSNSTESLSAQLPRRSAELIALALCAIGIFSIVVGFGDIARALSFSAMLRGAFFLLASIVLFFGAWDALSLAAEDPEQNKQDRDRARQSSGIIALVASAFGVLVGVFMLLLQSRGGDGLRRTFVWFVLIAVAAWCFITLWWQANVRVRPTSGLVTVLEVAALIALLEFGFSDLYLPAQAALNLNLTARFGNIEYEPQRRQLAVPVTVRMRNTSTVRVSLLASSYTITGMKASTSTKGTTIGMLMQKAARKMLPVTRFHEPTRHSLVQADHLFAETVPLRTNDEGSGSNPVTLEPGEEMTRSLIAYVPMNAGSTCCASILTQSLSRVTASG